jgi:hypothetical protein
VVLSPPVGWNRFGEMPIIHNNIQEVITERQTITEGDWQRGTVNDSAEIKKTVMLLEVRQVQLSIKL